MKNLSLLLVIFSLLNVNQVFAQYIPLFCDAKLPTGTDYTSGKDSGGKPCFKLANAKGFTIYHGKEGITYQAVIDSEILVLGESYVVLRKASKDVAWFDREFLVGWKSN